MRQPALLVSEPVAVDRAVALRVLAALRSTLTPAGHLAQRVTHEHLGYCGWRTESDRCVEMRQLLADVERALEPPSRAGISSASRTTSP